MPQGLNYDRPSRTCKSKRLTRGFERFYEKVIKVKADVAALLNLFSDVSIDCTIKLGTKPNAVQLSFVP